MGAMARSQFSGLLGHSWPQLRWAMLGGTHSEEGSACMWKTLTCALALPGVGVRLLNIFLKSRHGEERSEFTFYARLHVRSKPFPWGAGNRGKWARGHQSLLGTGRQDQL
uniref:Uncharacterized protein n=1 Tax=Catagonus wagneri TaxID=51154 RepID=A0A8C3YDJ2_9CETA